MAEMPQMWLDQVIKRLTTNNAAKPCEVCDAMAWNIMGYMRLPLNGVPRREPHPEDDPMHVAVLICRPCGNVRMHAASSVTDLEHYDEID